SQRTALALTAGEVIGCQPGSPLRWHSSSSNESKPCTSPYLAWKKTWLAIPCVAKPAAWKRSARVENESPRRLSKVQRFVVEGKNEVNTEPIEGSVQDAAACARSKTTLSSPSRSRAGVIEGCRP